mgnify:CR=1 FL=1
MPQYSLAPNSRIPIEIRYRDDELLVVEKPTGIVTQPGKGHVDDSLLNGLFVEFGNSLQNMGEERTWGLLHRLDKDTSGLVIVALRINAYDALREQFEKRLVKKVYYAVVKGTPTPKQGVIQGPIAEVTAAKKIGVIHRDGKQAITAYKVLQSTGDMSLVEARPKTGRLHQIRVHLASKGHPILGEDLYRGEVKMPPVPRLCLHAGELSFIHPTTGHRVTVVSPWPADFLRVCKRMGLDVPE